ncbi:MAG: aminoglycoside phosphotransferase family protein [Anaerolineae bacterium]|nr:aminoglycoside phosphotransferase family protein [Anaerolineae bacterium]
MSKVVQLTQQIRTHYPELEVETAVLNQEGQYNDVLIVNDALVFRFAKVPAAIATLQHEIAIQTRIADRLSLSIPYPIYAHTETTVIGEAFVGYHMIPGRPLWRDAFKAITNANARRRMAVQLAQFLYELHHIPVREVIPTGLPIRDTRQEWADLYQRIQARLFGYMRPDARQQTSTHFRDFLDNPDRYAFEPALRHGDFGTGNIIYDPVSLSIVGIVDFGGAGLGDPATDFAGLYISYGEPFYEHGYVVYPEMEQALHRVHFYCGTFALQEALFGIENDDQEAFESGIATYV